MAYTPPYTFADGTNLSATELEETTQSIRTYLNEDIAQGDLGGDIDREDFRSGRPFGVTLDHLFDSGEHYTNLKAFISIPEAFRDWHTASIKKVNPVGDGRKSASDLQPSSTRWVSCPEMAKEIYLEAPARLIICATWSNYEEPVVQDYNMYSDSAPPGPCWGVDSRWALSIDGDVDSYVDDTQGMSFTEDIRSGITLSPSAHSVAVNMNGVGRGLLEGEQSTRKRGSIDYLTGVLDPGWHKIQIVVNPRSHLGGYGSFNFSVEVLYEGGFQPPTLQQSGVVRKNTITNY